MQFATGELLAARTHNSSNETSVVCSRSEDGGRTWRDLSTIVRVPGPQGLGDGHLVQRKGGEVLYSFRQNSARAASTAVQTYSIWIAVSRGGGTSWQPHSVVPESEARPGETRGLWSSFLLERRGGLLLCFYGDEATSDREGSPRHQWFMVKTWHPQRRAWEQPVVVSRAAGRTWSRPAQPIFTNSHRAYAPGEADMVTRTRPCHDMRERARAAMRAGVLKGILWHQCEADKNNPGYGKRLAELIARLRQDLAAPAVPFVASELTPLDPENAEAVAT